MGTAATQVRDPNTGEVVFEKGIESKKSYLRLHCQFLIDFLKRATTVPTGLHSEWKVSSPLLIYEPYEIVFHHLHEILQPKSQETEACIRHVNLFLDFVHQEHPLRWQKANEVQSRECKKITFNDSWLLYRPGTTVLRRDNSVWRAYKVGRLEAGIHSNMDTWDVHCYYLDFDRTGKWLVPHPEVFIVHSYPSERSVSTFDIIPEWYFNAFNDFFPQVLGHASQYWDYGGNVHHREYHGDAWPKMPLDVSRTQAPGHPQPAPSPILRFFRAR